MNYQKIYGKTNYYQMAYQKQRKLAKRNFTRTTFTVQRMNLVGKRLPNINYLVRHLVISRSQCSLTEQQKLN